MDEGRQTHAVTPPNHQNLGELCAPAHESGRAELRGVSPMSATSQPFHSVKALLESGPASASKPAPVPARGIPDLQFIKRHVAIAEVASALEIRVEGKTAAHCWRPENHQHGRKQFLFRSLAFVLFPEMRSL